MRIYSIILTSVIMICMLLNTLKEDSKDARAGKFLAFLLYLPMWIYLIRQ